MIFAIVCPQLSLSASLSRETATVKLRFDPSLSRGGL
jgi:hypothetical protein